MINENMYKDVEQIIQMQNCTSALERHDIITVLTGIMLHEKRKQREAQLDTFKHADQEVDAMKVTDAEAKKADKKKKGKKYKRQVTMANIIKQNKAALME